MCALRRSRPIRVLVVDDEADFRALIRWSFGPEIVICGEAADGAEAVERVRDLCPDAILLDVRMPVMDGVEAASRIKRLCPHTKIIVTSAHPSALAEVPEADWYLEKLHAPPTRIREAILELCR